MSTTHAATGAALAVPLLPLAPELAVVAGGAAYAGGVFPDLDVLWRHRATLHFPAYYAVVATPALVVAALAPGPATVGVAAFLVSAALHSVTDALGGSLGLRPWANDDSRAVYLHARDRWLRARGLVRYDGAPEDLVLCGLLTVPPAVAFSGELRAVALAGLAVSVAYAAGRKRLPGIVELVR